MTIAKILYPAFLVSGLLLLTGCPNPCKDVECPPNSFCSSGECFCDDGYTKDANGNCVLPNSQLAGTWNATDSCSASGVYTGFTVTSKDSMNFVVWNNLYEAGENTLCTVGADGTSCTIIPGQLVDGFPVSGSCTLNADGTATFNYNLQWTSTVDSCTLHLSK